MKPKCIVLRFLLNYLCKLHIQNYSSMLSNCLGILKFPDYVNKNQAKPFGISIVNCKFDSQFCIGDKLYS